MSRIRGGDTWNKPEKLGGFGFVWGMWAAQGGEKPPPQRNKTGAGGKDVSFEASNNQQGHACGVEPWRAARPLRASAALRNRRSAPKNAAAPPRLGDLHHLGSVLLGLPLGNEF